MSIRHLLDGSMVPGEPRCTCDVAGSLRAVLEGGDAPLCEVHQAGEIQRREVERVRSEAQAASDRLHDAWDRQRAEDTARAEARLVAKQEQAEAAAMAELGKVSPLAAQLIRKTGGSAITALEQSRSSTQREWPGLNSVELENNVRQAFTDTDDLPPAA